MEFVERLTRADVERRELHDQRVKTVQLRGT